MNAADVIGHLYRAAIAEPGCCVNPDPLHAECGMVFADQRSKWDWDGLTCWECSATIIPADCCPTCERSLRDDHADYIIGPSGSAPMVRVCPTNSIFGILVREHLDAARSIIIGQTIATYEQIVPALTADDALDLIRYRFAGTVATFDILTVETQEEYA